MIAVAATQPDDSIAPFSTNGDFVDVVGPGDAVLSTWDSRLDNTAATPADQPPTHGHRLQGPLGHLDGLADRRPASSPS